MALLPDGGLSHPTAHRAIFKKSNLKIIYLHARECIEQLSLGNIDVGFSGIDLLKESEINIQNKISLCFILLY